MHAILELFRGPDGLADEGLRGHLAGLAPTLTLGGADDRVGPVAKADQLSDAAEAQRLAALGFAALHQVASPEACVRMVEAIDHLVAASLPAVFLYLFDEPWVLGLRIASRVSRMLGHSYELLDDCWAWRIEPGGKGWPPHRGISKPLLERRAPELINVWVALSDAGVERSCMHFVALDDDRSYPGELAGVSAPLEVARAAPLGAGSALAWNANILHWGGPCSPHAAGPRVSCSFSLGRSDMYEQLGFRAGGLASTDLRARLDSVALQIDVYGEGQLDVSPAVLEWARATRALGVQVSQLPQLP